MPIKLGKWLSGIWTGIKKIFNKFPKEVKKAIQIGVVVVDNIKKFVDSPVADVITTLIPGDVDDKIKQKLREELPKIFTELKLAEQCSSLTDPNEIVQCAIKTLQQISGDYKSDFLDAIAVHVSVIAADGKVDWDDVKYITKWYFDHIHKPSLVVET